MKKAQSLLKNKSVKELEQEVESVIDEITKLRLKSKVNPQKDTNMIVKKRKSLARALTLLTEKKQALTVGKSIK